MLMKNLPSITSLLFFFTCLVLPGRACAQEAFQEWLNNFRQEAVSAGISQNIVSKALDDIGHNDLVLRLDRNQPEFHLSLNEYLQRTVSHTRSLKGKRFYSEKKELLRDIAGRYGVPPQILLALWGIETDFGRVTGRFPVIEALATLAYDPRRSDFFKKELIDALHVVDRGYLSLPAMKGSWAGALGYLQFLPSVYLHYGVDYNRDGAIDIWQGGGDLFASGANYLAASGWQPHWIWGREVTISDGLNKTLLGLSQKKMLFEWQGLGVRRLNGAVLPSAKLMASLIQPDTGTERYFLVYDNFRVLLKWNRSTYYAVAVGLLSDKIME